MNHTKALHNCVITTSHKNAILHCENVFTTDKPIMKNRTKLFAFGLFAALALFTSVGCSKYDDNDGITLISRSERVANTWKIDSYKVDGVDLTPLYTGYTETYTKEKNYSYKWGAVSGTGTWAFQNNDEELRVTGLTNQATHTQVILKLEEKALWYYIMDGDKKREFHFVQN